MDLAYVRTNHKQFSDANVLLNTAMARLLGFPQEQGVVACTRLEAEIGFALSFCRRFKGPRRGFGLLGSVFRANPK